MSNVMIGVLAIAVLFVLMASRMWIGLGMTVIGFLGIVLIRGLPQAMSVVGSVPFATMNNYSMTAIPMFLLMGMIISETNIGSGLYKAANAWIGRIRGGLATATAVACGLLGAICSTSQTAAIIMSKIAYPEMVKRDYDDGFACGAIAAGGPLSIIIPPSMCFIMYGILTEQSVGKLFMSGFIPGVLLMIAYAISVSITMRLKPEWGPRGEKCSLRQKLGSLVDIAPMVILFIVVFGGIYGGIFTTTESGGIGAVGAIVIAAVTKQLSWKKLGRCIISTAMIASTIVILMSGTFIFSSFMTMSGLPQALASLVTSLNAPNIVVILIIMLIYIIMGMFMPDNPMVVLTVPILYPIILSLGIDPIWFGTFVVFMVSMAQISPPVGMVVYYLSALTGVKVNRAFAGVMPFLIAMLVVILLIIVFPQLCTFLPSVMA